MTKLIRAQWLGRVPYADAHALQERLMDARIRVEIDDTLLFLEHPPVITLGRTADHGHIVSRRDHLASLGVEIAETGRGGDVTYHAPGQLVAYPIFDLKPDRCDVRRYVRDLANTMIAMLRESGIEAGRIDGDAKYIGVWVDLDSPQKWHEIDASEMAATSRRLAKIGAIGVKISRWVTMHGFALNVTTDLSGFNHIVPCGIEKFGVTSMQAVQGGAEKQLSPRDLVPSACTHFARIFDAEITQSNAP